MLFCLVSLLEILLIVVVVFVFCSCSKREELFIAMFLGMLLHVVACCCMLLHVVACSCMLLHVVVVVLLCCPGKTKRKIMRFGFCLVEVCKYGC